MFPCLSMYKFTYLYKPFLCISCCFELNKDKSRYYTHVRERQMEVFSSFHEKLTFLSNCFCFPKWGLEFYDLFSFMSTSARIIIVHSPFLKWERGSCWEKVMLYMKYWREFYILAHLLARSYSAFTRKKRFYLLSTCSGFTKQTIVSMKDWIEWRLTNCKHW